MRYKANINVHSSYPLHKPPCVRHRSSSIVNTIETRFKPTETHNAHHSLLIRLHTISKHATFHPSSRPFSHHGQPHTSLSSLTTIAHSASTAPSILDPGSDSPSSSPSPSSVFFRTVFPTSLALLLCNMDRICLSVAMLPISKELAWGESIQGLVQSAFLWGYLANQLLGGTMADMYGGKKVMAWGIAFFSLSSMLLPLMAITPWTASLGLTLPAVALSRFLVGFGEGVALPSMNNLIATRISPGQRATALGSAFMGFHAGNLVGLIFSPVILQNYGWRALFYVFGLLGLPLLLLWQIVVPSTAATKKAHRSVAGALDAQASSNRVSFSAMLRNKHVWAIIIANIVNHWGYFMYLNWMPTYFSKSLGMDLRASSLMSFLPWLVMAAGSSFSGLVSDSLVNAGMSAIRVRKAVQSVAFLGPVIPLLALASGSLISNPLHTVVAMTAALGITSIGQFVANMSDIAPRHAGRLFGLCNTFGSMSGILSVSLAGLVVEKTGSFSVVFLTTAMLNVLGVVAWNMLCTSEKQFE